MLADLRDSQENILGKIVHQDQFKKDDFDNSYRKYKAMLSFQIPKSLRDLYDNLYNEVRAEVKTLPSKSDEFKTILNRYLRKLETLEENKIWCKPNGLNRY